MAVTYQERVSDSPFVETIWQVQAVSDGSDTVTADVSWDMLIVTQDGKTSLSVWGPTTSTRRVSHLAGHECFGIRFKLGTFMPHLSAEKMLNQGITLPEATGNAFWLGSTTWELPNYENVDTFVTWLARRGLLGRDAVIEAALQGHSQDMSLRSVQRRFARITGLTQRYIRSIERAQQAASLLESGTSILDTVYQAGYADQQHMTTALKQLVGQTPAQIARIRSHE
jgi:AraC-like DNA-binding protein